MPELWLQHLTDGSDLPAIEAEFAKGRSWIEMKKSIPPRNVMSQVLRFRSLVDSLMRLDSADDDARTMTEVRSERIGEVNGAREEVVAALKDQGEVSFTGLEGMESPDWSPAVVSVQFVANQGAGPSTPKWWVFYFGWDAEALVQARQQDRAARRPS